MLKKYSKEEIIAMKKEIREILKELRMDEDILSNFFNAIIDSPRNPHIPVGLIWGA